MNTDLILIIVVCSFIGTVSIYSCAICYKNSIKKEQEKNRISSVHNRLKRKNIIRPIADEEEVKDEKFNDIKTVQIRTAEHFV